MQPGWPQLPERMCLVVLGAGTTFSAGAISLDTRWQPGPLQLMRRGSLASELSQMQTQAQWMQVCLPFLQRVIILITVFYFI